MNNVLVIGDGAAGLAAAITLRQHNKKVIVVQRPVSQNNVQAGESMPAIALAALKELGIKDEFLLAGHQPCHGNSSCWGNNMLSYFDFIQSPLGAGWYIDRSKFNKMLRAKAEKVGVRFFITHKAAELKKEKDDSWLYGCNNWSINADTIIDTSGRNSWISRQIGLKKTKEDKQIAAVCQLHSDGLKSGHSLVEAVEDGWWYVAEADNKTTCTFFTDLDLHGQNELANGAYLDIKKAQTIFVKHRVPVGQYKYVSPPVLTSACSSNLSQYAGPGWLVAGDAASAMDPLSSHGVAFALRSGIDAATAASSAFNKQATEMEEYNRTISFAVETYQQQRTKIYQNENRWPNSVYWQRRQLG